MLAGDGAIADQHLRLHRFGQMDEVDVAAANFRQRRIGRRRSFARRPAREDALDFVEHGGGGQVADQHQKRGRWTVALAVELDQMLAAKGGDLRFAGRDGAVGVRAEKHAAQAFAAEEGRRGALDAHAFEKLAALALEFLGRETRLPAPARRRASANRQRNR